MNQLDSSKQIKVNKIDNLVKKNSNVLHQKLYNHIRLNWCVEKEKWFYIIVFKSIQINAFWAIKIQSLKPTRKVDWPFWRINKKKLGLCGMFTLKRSHKGPCISWFCIFEYNLNFECLLLGRLVHWSANRIYLIRFLYSSFILLSSYYNGKKTSAKPLYV